MVVYENIFSRPLDTKFWLNWKKIFLIDNHDKIINESVRIDISSHGVL